MVVALIDFIQMQGAHSGANMAKAAFKTLEELDMKNKVSPKPLLPI
jgi:hypothetical protein